MTSKERVKRAFAHREPDRVPIDYLGNPGIDRRLKDHFGLQPDDDAGLRDALQVDFLGVDPDYAGPELHAPVPGRTIDIWGIHRMWIEHDSGGYWDYCDFPLQNAGMEEIEAWPFPSPDDFDYDAMATRCAAESDRYVMLGHPGFGDIINMTSMLRGMETVLMDLAGGEPETLRLIERRIDIQLEMMRRALQAARGSIDLIWIGEDLGTQIGPLVSPALFRAHIRPQLEKFVRLAHEHGLPTMVHSCGSSSWAYPDFIEMGVQVVDTLQPEAVRMAPAWLKSAYGADLSFHGCISTAGPVASGSREETIASVEEVLRIMMPGGGYALSPTHMLQDNSPTENVLAVYETALKMGRYS
ncbi:MAG: uroporphyrinogen decarboxylase family protein [Opitutaceae bacterium]